MSLPPSTPPHARIHPRLTGLERGGQAERGVDGGTKGADAGVYRLLSTLPPQLLLASLSLPLCPKARPVLVSTPPTPQARIHPRLTGVERGGGAERGVDGGGRCGGADVQEGVEVAVVGA